MPELFMETILYIIRAPYFFQSFGFSIATAMFIGASIYNGDVTKLTKGIVTVVSYAFFLLLITFSRIIDVGMSENGFTNPIQAHAGVFTIIIMTIAYVLGMYMGVITLKITRKKL